MKRSFTSDDEGPPDVWAYVAMTIAGRQMGEAIDWELHKKNRRFWNAQQATLMSHRDKERLLSSGKVIASDLEPLSEEELEVWRSVLAERHPYAHEENDLRPFVVTRNIMDIVCCKGFIFLGRAEFSQNHYRKPVYFDDAVFLGGASFNVATFQSDAHFNRTQFEGKTSFRECTFRSDLFFLEVNNRRVLDFSGALFGGRSIFNGSDFSSSVRFSSTTLHEASFEKEPPEMFDANFLGGVEFLQTKWPVPAFGWHAARARRSYERLKFLMDERKKVHDEHFFHRLEMKCREVEVGLLNSIPSRLFRLFSNYGWSLRRPALALVITFALGWVQILHVETGLQNALINSNSAAALSFSNTFGFLGLSSTFLSDELNSLSSPSQVTSAIQTILGLFFFFFLAMALRNRFRMS